MAKRSGLMVLAAAALVWACPAAYPEVGTNLREAPGRLLDPPPPEDVRWIRVRSARIPERTPDGRTWTEAFGSPPDPYAQLFVNGKRILRTPIQADTLEPTWPTGPRGNFAVLREDRLRIELWDGDPRHRQPIGAKDIERVTDDQRAANQIQVELGGGAEVTLAFEPAHAMFGLGLWYELRPDALYVTRMLPQSPAERAGLIRGDQIVQIGGRAVDTMTAEEVRAALANVAPTGVAVVVKHPDGATLEVRLREGPIYPTYDLVGTID